MSGGSSSGRKHESVVSDCGRRKSTCGYCRSPARTSITHGLMAESLTVYDYQDLLDRGWRRSGCFLYKPEMEKTCCPSYTIRLKAADFIPNKEQLRVSRRMQRFLDGELDLKKVVGEPSTSNQQVSTCVGMQSFSAEGGDKYIKFLSEEINNVVIAWVNGEDFPSGIQLPKASVKKVLAAKRKLQAQVSEDLLYSSNIAFQIAAVLKRAQSNVLSPETIAEKLAILLNNLPETFGPIRACNGHINFYSTKKDTSPSSGTAKGVCKESGGKEVLECSKTKKRNLEIRLKRSAFDPEEFKLYKRYQMSVHNDKADKVTEISYRRFLVDSPFVPADGQVPSCGYGAFHQQYLIDGQLVAVGVIDILPRCLSSKYLFWDPDYAALSLGKYTALQEISWVKENQAHCSTLQYYYLGYYIHSCLKMRYKAAYGPSQLLCPLRYQWVSFDIARPLLDRKKYVVLSDYASSQNGDSLLHEPGNLMELKYGEDDVDQQDNSNELMDVDQELYESDTESSDEELGLESTGMLSGVASGDVTSILIGLGGSRRRYEDIQRAVSPSERSKLESQLRRYSKVVGEELSERLVYSLW